MKNACVELSIIKAPNGGAAPEIRTISEPQICSRCATAVQSSHKDSAQCRRCLQPCNTLRNRTDVKTRPPSLAMVISSHRWTGSNTGTSESATP